jgi:hypothetical protein
MFQIKVTNLNKINVVFHIIVSVIHFNIKPSDTIFIIYTLYVIHFPTCFGLYRPSSEATFISIVRTPQNSHKTCCTYILKYCIKIHYKSYGLKFYALYTTTLFMLHP